MKNSWNVISFILILLFAGLAVLVFHAYSNIKADRDRLRENQSVLLHNGEVEITETTTGHSHASAPSILITPKEFRHSGERLGKVARQIRIKDSRIAEAATALTRTRATLSTSLHSLPLSELGGRPDSSTHPARHSFSYVDPWLTIEGTIHPDTLAASPVLAEGGRGEALPGQLVGLSLESRDTLDIIVHRVPKRFLFFRFGCKQVRMDIVSRNPYTRITHARYYKLKD